MSAKRRKPGPESEPQAQAVCPRCRNIVYADGLEYSDFVVCLDGAEHPRTLRIECESCGKRSIVRLHRH